MRYTIARKEELIKLVAKEPHRRLEILAVHNISEEEFASWERYYSLGDKNNLRTTRLQEVRRECGDKEIFQ